MNSQCLASLKKLLNFPGPKLFFVKYRITFGESGINFYNGYILSKYQLLDGIKNTSSKLF